MSEEIEIPNEALERHETAKHVSAGGRHGSGQHSESHARWTTMLVIVLAMAAAIASKVSTRAEIDYLTYHIEASDIWAQYQGKSDRGFMAQSLADYARAQPTASDPRVQAMITQLESSAARLDFDDDGHDGRKQLADKARRVEELREHAAGRLEGFEMVVSILAISIALGSASMVAKSRMTRNLLGGVSALAGLGATLYGVVAFLA